MKYIWFFQALRLSVTSIDVGEITNMVATNAYNMTDLIGSAPSLAAIPVLWPLGKYLTHLFGYPGEGEGSMGTSMSPSIKELLAFHIWMKCTSFSVWVRYLSEITNGIFEIPHKIYWPYIERCDYFTALKCQELSNLIHTHNVKSSQI